LRPFFFFAIFTAFFLRFAIAALLAMMSWRVSHISGVANRRTLHFDYYSTTKKTATPLNEGCTRDALARCADVAGARRVAMTRRKKQRWRRIARLRKALRISR
jgi:hypothetical protein